MRSTVQTNVTVRVQVIRQNRVAVAGSAGCNASLRYSLAPTGKPGIKELEHSRGSFSSDPHSDRALMRDPAWDRLPGRLSLGW